MTKQNKFCNLERPVSLLIVFGHLYLIFQVSMLTKLDFFGKITLWERGAFAEWLEQLGYGAESCQRS